MWQHSCGSTAAAAARGLPAPAGAAWVGAEETNAAWTAACARGWVSNLPPPPQMSDKERKKINEKTRKQQEAAARAKADALRDDDNVFDVSFEQQGAGGEAADSVVSATDIKVICLLTPPMTCAHGILEVMRYMAAARGPASSCVVFGLQPRHVQNADGTACVASQSRGSQPACSR